MASSSDTAKTRHVGLIVDPDVREDGGTEPEMRQDRRADLPDISGLPAERPAADPTDASAQAAHALVETALGPAGHDLPPDERHLDLGEQHTDPTRGQLSLGRGQTVRERLLARAAAVRGARPASAAAELDAIARGRTTEELGSEAIGEGAESSRAPSAPQSHRRRAEVSPTMLAVLGSLMGLATVASLIALVMHVAPTERLETAPSAPKVTEATLPSPTSGAPSAAPSAARAIRERVRLPGPWRIADESGNASRRVIEGKIGDKPFLRAIQDAGVPMKQAYRVTVALKELRNLDRCDRSDRFVALLDRASQRLVAFEYMVSKEEVYQAREGEDGLLAGQKLDLKVKRERVEGALLLGSEGLDAAARDAGLEPAVRSALETAFQGHTSVEQLEPRTRIRLVLQEVTVLGEFSRYAGLDTVEVLSPRTDAAPLRIYYFRGPRSSGYFDGRGRSFWEGGWRKPVKGPMTSPFNPKRFHPVLKRIMPHNGIDYGAPTGTPVYASSFGVVSSVGYAGGFGNLVRIEHPGNIMTEYAHLSRFAEGLRAGDKVARMQVIGYVGSTGRSTGPHLHFGVKKNGKYVDPLSLNLDGLRVLPVEDRPEFERVKARLDAELDSIKLPPLPEASPDVAAAVAEAPLADAELLGSAGGDGEGEMGEDTSMGAPAPPAAPPPKPAASNAANAIYLTDEELVKLQR